MKLKKLGLASDTPTSAFESSKFNPDEPASLYGKENVPKYPGPETEIAKKTGQNQVYGTETEVPRE
jgi:hypothetical protein